MFDLRLCLVRWPGVSSLVFDAVVWNGLLATSGLQALLDATDVAPALPQASFNCILFLVRLMANTLAADDAEGLVEVPLSIATTVRLTARLANLVEAGRLEVADKKHLQVWVSN